jgi:SWI/SNF-related matrix-associated actin-dependent regulator of chromatin subfamily A-like protein 1
MKTTPHAYQMATVEAAEAWGGRALFALDPGTGKSLCSLLYAYRDVSRYPAVVVCPAGLKWNWEKEARQHFGMRCEILSGVTPVKAGLRTNTKIWIVNYDILYAWVPFLRSLNPQTVILDECHMLRSPRTRRTKAVQKLCKDVPGVLALSGTPLLKRTVELYPVLNLLRPDLFPNFFMYASLYCKKVQTRYGIRYESRNLPTLNRLMKKELMVRIRKADVLHELPAKSRHVVMLHLEKETAYKKAVRTYLEWVESQKTAVKKTAYRQEQREHLSNIKKIIAQDKMPGVFDWVDSFLEASEGKVLLFCVHHVVVDALRERYKKTCAVVTGKVTGKDREIAYRKFNEDETCRVFIGNIQAAGVGWNCTSASTVAFVELAWAPGDHAQCEDRIHGIKRGIDGTRSEAYYLVAGGTIEEKICRLLQRESNDVHTVLDGEGHGENFDIYDQLTEEMRNG